MCRGPEENLRRFHERLGNRRVRMNAQRQILNRRSHLDGNNAFGDEFTGSSPDNSNTQDPLRL